MSVLQSKINPRSDEFQANHQAMQQAVADLREKVEKIHLIAAARPNFMKAAPLMRQLQNKQDILFQIVPIIFVQLNFL